MVKKPVKTIVRSIRLPEPIWEALNKRAKEHRRTIAAELILWLETAKERFD